MSRITFHQALQCIAPMIVPCAVCLSKSEDMYPMSWILAFSLLYVLIIACAVLSSFVKMLMRRSSCDAICATQQGMREGGQLEDLDQILLAIKKRFDIKGRLIKGYCLPNGMRQDLVELSRDEWGPVRCFEVGGTAPTEGQLRELAHGVKSYFRVTRFYFVHWAAGRIQGIWASRGASFHLLKNDEPLEQTDAVESTQLDLRREVRYGRLAYAVDFLVFVMLPMIEVCIAVGVLLPSIQEFQFWATLLLSWCLLALSVMGVVVHSVKPDFSELFDKL